MINTKNLRSNHFGCGMQDYSEQKGQVVSHLGNQNEQVVKGYAK